jgi:adenosylcobinamide-phosphate synthase
VNLSHQIMAAVALDLLIGDPPWLPHPVRGIGLLAQRLEGPMRRLVPNERAAGTGTVLLVVAIPALAVWALMRSAALLHPVATDAVAVLAIYTSLAARDLARHSLAVFKALASGDLPLARTRVAQIVGRDTAQLDESGVTRAAVECVAESTVDGVTAPLFFAILGGPIGAMAYRAVNTLDSTFGYKTERYLKFGWAAARLDDVANYLPARLTAPLVGVAAALLGRHPVQAWLVLRRDGRKHESPNAGLTEAAVAGALGVQLGGLNYYEGEPLAKPTLGDPNVPLIPAHIQTANALMLLTLCLFLAIGLPARVVVLHLWRTL